MKDILSKPLGKATKYNLSKEEYLTMHSMQDGKSVVIKPTGKGSATELINLWQNWLIEEGREILKREKNYKIIKITQKDHLQTVENIANCFLT